MNYEVKKKKRFWNLGDSGYQEIKGKVQENEINFITNGNAKSSISIS